MTLCGVAMMSIASFAQQTDTARIQNDAKQRTETGAQDQSSDRATQGQPQTQDQSTTPTTDSTTVDRPVDNGQNGTATPQDQSTQSGQTNETGTDRKKKAKKNTP